MTIKKGVINSQETAKEIRENITVFRVEIFENKPSAKEKKTILNKLEAIEALALKIKQDVIEG